MSELNILFNYITITNRKRSLVVLRSNLFRDRLIPVKSTDTQGRAIDVSMYLYWDEFKNLLKTSEMVKEQCIQIKNEILKKKMLCSRLELFY